MNVLSIGGSDPSTGAGIQNDVLAFSNMGAYPLTAVTAITVQNTSEFTNVESISTKIFEEQLESIFDDFTVDGIKIGMVYSSEIIKVISKKLQKIKIPIHQGTGIHVYTMHPPDIHESQSPDVWGVCVCVCVCACVYMWGCEAPIYNSPT